MSPRIVFLDRSTTDAGDLDLSALEDLGSVTSFDRTNPEETALRLGGCQIALTNKVVLDSAAMDAAPDLALIQVVATGVNNVDLPAARERGIAVCNVRGYSTPGVAQHVFALLLNLVGNVHRFEATRARWADSPIFTRLDYPVVELRGKTLGIVGLGDIGGTVADIGAAFGMRVVALQREGSAGTTHGSWERLPQEAFFSTCDVISLHCPLTPETRHLINRDTLSLMKNSAFLINTGRGDLVHEEDLAEALRRGEIAGAGLDVLSSEPPARDHPLLRTDLPGLIVTPHTAWTAVESRHRLVDEVVRNIRAFLDGDRRNRVD